MKRLVVLIVIAACGGKEAAPPPAPRDVANLRAFARLYSVVRFFHPSDEAAATDWARLAVVGVRRVRGAADPRALDAALEGLFAPIAPAVQILGPGEAPRDLALPAGDEVVSWQYLGPGFDGGQAGVYLGKRTAREGWTAGEASWGAMRQTVDATPLRGKRVRLRAWLRAGAPARVGAWLRVDAADGRGFFDNMQDRSVTAAAWTEATIEGPVAADATRVVVGMLVEGVGEGAIDDVELAVEDGRGGWTPVPLVNPGFEEGTTGWTVGVGRERDRGTEYAFEAIPDGHTGGAARLARARQLLVGDLFAERAALGEIAEVDLGDGLRARVPIALPGQGGRTLPAGAPVELPAFDAGSAEAWIADVIVAWSVLDQFYPYFDVVDVDWGRALDDALADALDDRTSDDHRRTLERLVAAAQDGHGHVMIGAPPARLPVRLAWVEERIVVETSNVPDLASGDVLLAVDGVDAARALDERIARTSGSPQWRRVAALGALGSGPADTEVVLRVERDGAPREVTVRRGEPGRPLHVHPPVAEVEPGVWYVDLDRAEGSAIREQLDAIAAARGVVFDLRGYPNGNHFVLQHLLDAPERDRWMHVAQLVRPRVGGARAEPAWSSVGWDLAPAAPRIRGKVVFVTGPGAISYAESVMGYVEALGLPIVGAATAGTNGNVRTAHLPSGASVLFTGMRVTRHDGSPSHLVGIRPTIPAAPTLAGVRAGKDEVLERALEVVRSP